MHVTGPCVTPFRSESAWVRGSIKTGEPATARFIGRENSARFRGNQREKAFWLEMVDEISLSLGISACAEIV